MLEGDIVSMSVWSIFIDHTNIAKYVQKFPVSDVPELVLVYQGAQRCQ